MRYYSYYSMLFIIAFPVQSLFGQKPDTTRHIPIQDSSLSSDAITAGNFSRAPRLISGGKITINPLLLKKGISATIPIEIALDKDGKMEHFSVKNRSNRIVDSLLHTAIPRFAFSPAIENGKYVSSTLLLQIEFNPDSIIAEMNAAVPVFDGRVMDRESNDPIPNAEISIRYVDSTSDPDISIGFTNYLQSIGSCSGQHYSNGALSTVTDSAAHFAFRLMPCGQAAVSVRAEGYEPVRSTEHLRSDHRLQTSYFLTRIDKTVRDSARSDPADTITVYGVPNEKHPIDVERKQIATGLTHHLCKLLLSQTAIRQIPEAGSLLLVRSGSPFDNRYIIAGVPFLSPFHFGGNPYADVDGMMISSLHDIQLSIDGIAGRRTDASGMIVEANPGVYRPANPRLLRRPEFVIDYSPISQDMLLSLPSKRSTADYSQIGFTRSDEFQLKWLHKAYHSSEIAEYNNGAAISFVNFTFNSITSIDSMQFHSFAWLAMDGYCREVVPWGMASVRFRPAGRNDISALCGGARQYSIQGKRVGNDVFMKKVFLSNGVLAGEFDRPIGDAAAIHLECAIDYHDWDGTVRQTDTAGMDTTLFASGKETGCHIHGRVEKKSGVFETNINFLCAGTLYDERTMDFIFDAGISFTKTMGDFHTELHLGRVTARPDIRGLPDDEYRCKHLYNYLAACPVTYRAGTIAKVECKPYIRYLPECPEMDPLFLTWNQAGGTKLLAKGVDIANELRITRDLAINGTVNLASAQRVDGTIKTIYEFTIPWTVRSGIHYSFFRKKGHLYVNYIHSSGLPYYDFNDARYLVLPDYKRVDLSLQYRTPMLPHRFLTRYDAYFNVNNLFDMINIRDYYWNREMVKKPVWLSPVYCDFGLRAGFRL